MSTFMMIGVADATPEWANEKTGIGYPAPSDVGIVIPMSRDSM
jgi:hypothetical protein